jgi:S1-C subfamily serine protease
METRLKHLLARAERAFQSQPPSHTLQRVRAIVGPSNMPATEDGVLANQALDALRSMQIPSPKQLAALEQMIRLLRPAPLVRNGRPDDFADPLFAECFPFWQEFQRRFPDYAASVGRVGFPDNREVGTGFLVSSGLVATNTHVLMKLSNGTGLLQTGQAIITFKYEYQSPKDAPSAIIGVKALHEKLDVVLLMIEDSPAEERKPLPISTAMPEVGTAVVAVGFPAEDSNNPLFIRPLFGDKYEVKRASPGEIIDAAVPIFYHDCSTLGGNSGSPMFRMDTAEVIGIHKTGAYFKNSSGAKRRTGPNLCYGLKSSCTGTPHHAPTFFARTESFRRATGCGGLRTRRLGSALAASADFRNS